MEILSSAEAAARLDVNAQKFHRLVAKYQITPVIDGKGIRGWKFWNAADIDRLAAELTDVA